MTTGEKITATLPGSWRKSFNSGAVIPVKKRFCKKFSDKLYMMSVIIELTKIRNLKLI